MKKTTAYPDRRDSYGELIQTLSNGFRVFTLRSNPDKTVTLNARSIAPETMPIQEFHKLGGFVGLYHEHLHDDRAREIHGIQTAFVPYR